MRIVLTIARQSELLYLVRLLGFLGELVLHDAYTSAATNVALATFSHQVFLGSIQLRGGFAFALVRLANISMQKHSFLRACARNADLAILAWRSSPSPFALSSAYRGYARLPSQLFPRRHFISKSMLPGGVSGWLLENRAATAR